MATADELLTQVNALIPRVDALVGRRELREAQTVAWWAGSATGGPNGDGRYPLTANDGTVRLVPSPAAIAALAASGGAGGGGLDAAGVAALLEGTPANAGAGFRFLGVAADGTPMRFAPAILPNPIPELPRVTEAFATDLIEISRGGVRTGLALSAFTRLTTGKINVKEAPYNCKGDLREVRDGVVALYSNTLKSASNPWVPADVGKLLFIGNRGAGRGTMPRKITGVVSAGEITFGPAVEGGTSAASYGASGLHVAWGTDDTVGLRLALQAAAPLAALSSNGFGGVVELPPGYYLTDNLQLPARTALFGYGPRQSVICRKPSSSGLPTITHTRKQDDFAVFVNMGVYGLKNLQGATQRGIVLDYTAGFGSYFYTDPFPHIEGVHLWETNGDALCHFGQGNGIFGNINIVKAAGCGFRSHGYDMAISSLYVIDASGCAVFCDYGSAGNNINNGKFSFSGGFATPLTGDGFDAGVLVYLGYESSILKFNNCRVQESFLSGWAIAGRGHSLTACAAEDTGNVGTLQGVSAAVPPPDKPRAALQMLPGATECVIDLHVTYGIPYNAAINRATHACFFSNPAGKASATYNRADIHTYSDMRTDAGYYNGGTDRTGRTTQPTTGAYARAVYGTDDPAGISATNDDFKINGVQIA